MLPYSKCNFKICFHKYLKYFGQKQPYKEENATTCKKCRLQYVGMWNNANEL